MSNTSSARPEVKVRVIPRAGRTAISGMRGDAVLVRLAAAPVDGAANDALIALLADALGCPRRSLTIVSGARSRAKRIAVDGMTRGDIDARLSALIR
jgi:uncharacterized protein (TIGR00251 family)